MSAKGQLLWTGEQHAWLQALGHTVWVPGSLPVAVAPARVPEAGPSSRPAPSPRQPAPSSRAPAPPAPDHAQTQPARHAPAAAPRAAARLHDTLRFELIRASGLNPSASESAAIIASWPDTALLRGNPQAKRALWPLLRALRKAGR